MSNLMCPLESLNVSKQGTTLKLDATRRGSTNPEPSKYFNGPNRFNEFKRFWDFLTKNTPEFANCTNPLNNDPEYQSAVGMNNNMNMPIGMNTNTPTGMNTNTPTGMNTNTPTGNASSYVSSTTGTWSGSLLPDTSNPVTSLDYTMPSTDPYVTQLLANTTNSSYNTDNNLKVDSIHILIYLIRVGIIFVFIFLLLTYIPVVKISLINKLIICTAIIFLHSIIDGLIYLFNYIKSGLCSTACGC